MGTKDSKAKEYLSDNTRFSEICNYVLFDGEKVIHAYRFRTDLLMENDVKDTMPQDIRQAMEKQLKSIIQQYMQRMNTNGLVYRE